METSRWTSERLLNRLRERVGGIDRVPPEPQGGRGEGQTADRDAGQHAPDRQDGQDGQQHDENVDGAAVDQMEERLGVGERRGGIPRPTGLPRVSSCTSGTGPAPGRPGPPAAPASVQRGRQFLALGDLPLFPRLAEPSWRLVVLFFRLLVCRPSRDLRFTIYDLRSRLQDACCHCNHPSADRHSRYRFKSAAVCPSSRPFPSRTRRRTAGRPPPGTGPGPPAPAC